MQKVCVETLFLPYCITSALHSTEEKSVEHNHILFQDYSGQVYTKMIIGLAHKFYTMPTVLL